MKVNLAARAVIVVAIWLGLLALSAAPAVANACGQTISVSAHRSLGPGPPPLAVGDSVLYDAAGVLSNYGFSINAMVCRTMDQGIAWLQAHNQNLPVLVVVALGTNGSVTNAQIDQLLGLVGPQRILAMVTPHNGNYAYVPGLIRAAARQHPGRIEVLDWDQLSAGHANWFAPDGIHLGGTAGIDAFAQLVASSLLTTPGQASNIGTPTTIGPPTTIQPSSAPAQPRTLPSTAAPKQSRPRVSTAGVLRAVSAIETAWLSVASF